VSSSTSSSETTVFGSLPNGAPRDDLLAQVMGVDHRVGHARRGQ
jgi:hypothetical protein